MSTPPSLSEPSAPPPSAPWFGDDDRSHETALRGYLRRRFPSVDTDDVVQESYLKLLRSRTAVRIETAKAYLFSVACNTARRWAHRQRIFSDVPVCDLPPAQLVAQDDAAHHASALRERAAIVVESVDQLPARCREIMRLALGEGLTAAEIASRLGLSDATVRVQLARGVRRCARDLRHKGVTP